MMTKKKAWQVFCKAKCVILVKFTLISTEFNEQRSLFLKFETMKSIYFGVILSILLSGCSQIECSTPKSLLPTFAHLLEDGMTAMYQRFPSWTITLGDPQGQPKPITQKVIHDQEGVVELVMKVADDGQWKVVNLSATNEDLAKYVVSKLKEYQKQTPTKAIGQVVKYRFVFKQQT